MTREDAIKNLKWLLECSYVDSFEDAENEAIEMAIKALEQNESAEEWYKLFVEKLEQETGHWVKVTNGRGGHECDVCHDYAPSFQSGDEYLSPFCPNCGAKMQEVEE